MRHLLLLSWLCLTSTLLAQTQAQTQVQIIDYNVENLFHPSVDSVNTDTTFTFQGERRWTFDRYREKLAHIGQVVANIGQWSVPTLIGLEEVESEQCLIDLCRWGALSNYRYQYLHHDSPDERGIDCALLYQPKQFQLIDSAFIRVPIEGRPTRDIIYAAGRLRNGDTLHVFVCHFPSQRGGTALTNSRREAARKTLQTAIDMIRTTQPQALIVVMGDFNSAPTEQFTSLHNMMMSMEAEGQGTYKWHGVWSCLDHLYLSDALLPYAKADIYSTDWLLEDDTQYLGQKPFRMFQGYKYTAGYSDHLPIYLNLSLPK